MKETIIVLNHFVNNEYGYLPFTHNHAKTFVKMGFNVIVFAPFAIFPIFGLLKKAKHQTVDGVVVDIGKRYSLSSLFKNARINFNGIFYYFSIIKKIKKIIRENEVIHIDAHTFNCEGYAAYKIKKKYPEIKTTITFHGSDLEQAISHKNGIKRLKKTAKYIDYYICVSDKLTNKLQEIGITNVKTIYNGIEKHKISEVEKEKTFITVASLIEEKNIELLIDAFSELHKKNQDYKLKIIGEGPLKNNLLSKIKKYNIENNIILMGYLTNEEVYKELNKAYAFILISSPEGFGIVYPEAMFCGCITIGTKNEGIDGFIKNGQNGFLINPNIKEIINIMQYVISVNCDIIVKNGIRDAKKLTWEKNCQEYLNLKVGEVEK